MALLRPRGRADHLKRFVLPADCHHWVGCGEHSSMQNVRRRVCSQRRLCAVCRHSNGPFISLPVKQMEPFHSGVLQYLSCSPSHACHLSCRSSHTCHRTVVEEKQTKEQEENEEGRKTQTNKITNNNK